MHNVANGAQIDQTDHTNRLGFSILALYFNQTVCFGSAELDLSIKLRLQIFNTGTLSQIVLMDRMIHFDKTQSD